MRLFKYLLPLAIALGMTSNAFAQGGNDTGGISGHEEELNERDLQLLREFVYSKRQYDVADKSRNLSISGDVHFEWRHLNEKQDHVSLRGPKGKDNNCVPLSHNDFDVEFNLRFDYVYDRAWCAAHLQYDNSAGIDRLPCTCSDFNCCGSEDNCGRPSSSKQRCIRHRFHGNGVCDQICLKRAYMGYTVFADCGTLDVMIGRQMLYDVFESEIEFDNRMDGIVLKYANKWENVADWYAKICGFVVDERVNHYAYAAELAFFNILDSRLDFKYSFIDWRKRGRDRCGFHNPKGMKYAISQIILTYNLDPNIFCGIPADIYAAALVNHLANQVAHARKHENRRWGFYGGFEIGKVEKEGDWSFYIEYQYVQQFAISFDEESGIGLGNVLGDGCNKRGPTTGYQGFVMEALYALTDNLSIDTVVEWSRSTEKFQHTYSKFELEAVYAF